MRTTSNPYSGITGIVGEKSCALQEVVKKNGLTLTAMVIPTKDTNITPNIYLDSFYQEYRNGKDPDICVGDVADLWIENMDTDLSVDVNGMMDYGNVRDMLQIRMCDPEKTKNGWKIRL